MFGMLHICRYMYVFIVFGLSDVQIYKIKECKPYNKAV